jgi:hypothetical protein
MSEALEDREEGASHISTVMAGVDPATSITDARTA